MMQCLFAIASLTWKAAFRFRLFWVLTALLLGSVVGLPLLLKDDGTARGFTQILLTYTLSVITTLLGFTTLWLACGTLARNWLHRHHLHLAFLNIARQRAASTPKRGKTEQRRDHTQGVRYQNI